MSAGKKVLVGCGAAVALGLALAWMLSDRIALLFTMANVDPSGDVAVPRIDGGRADPPELPVFVDRRDGGG